MLLNMLVLFGVFFNSVYVGSQVKDIAKVPNNASLVFLTNVGLLAFNTTYEKGTVRGAFGQGESSLIALGMSFYYSPGHMKKERKVKIAKFFGISFKRTEYEDKDLECYAPVFDSLIITYTTSLDVGICLLSNFKSLDFGILLTVPFLEYSYIKTRFYRVYYYGYYSHTRTWSFFEDRLSSGLLKGNVNWTLMIKFPI